MNDAATSLQGQTALVTGAARRLGRATALALADAGADVIVHYNRSGEEAQETANRVRERGRHAWTLQADLDCPTEAETLLRRGIEAAGPVSILVNNASIFPAGTLLHCAAEEIWRNVRINAHAPLLLARELARQEAPGCVVNYLDCRIRDYDREHVPYHLSKRMLYDLTRMLALELAPRVRVNAVAPGLILPPPGKDEAYLQSLASTNPLQRHGAPEDITRAALFLVQSPFVTGQVLYVDGGRNLKGSVYG